jgi:hypothetical protein
MTQEIFANWRKCVCDLQSWLELCTCSMAGRKSSCYSISVITQCNVVVWCALSVVNYLPQNFRRCCRTCLCTACTLEGRRGSILTILIKCGKFVSSVYSKSVMKFCSRMSQHCKYRNNMCHSLSGHAINYCCSVWSSILCINWKLYISQFFLTIQCDLNEAKWPFSNIASQIIFPPSAASHNTCTDTIFGWFSHTSFSTCNAYHISFYSGT